MLTEDCKQPFIGAYSWATQPLRWITATHRNASGQAPVMVLFYHRVADDAPNAWTITWQRFQEQMDWIRHTYRIVSLVEAQRRLASGQNDQPVVAVTFDDGYADNCRAAVPWLIDEGIPFTYFVATRHVLLGEPFAHDVEAGAPQSPNSPEELREMANAGVEIGAHTRRHLDLGAIDDESVLHEEIVGSKRDLEEITGRAVRYFAFPFGMPQNMSSQAFRVAFRAGFWGVCSAYGAYNLPGADSFHLQRIHGDPSWARFRNWMTVDPRKIGAPSLFDPGDYRLCF